MHYEVELRELAFEDDRTGDLRVIGSTWKPMRLFAPGMIVAPLRFEALAAARAYIDGVSRDRVRIVCGLRTMVCMGWRSRTALDSASAWSKRKRQRNHSAAGTQ